jgi:hypothetical protein
MQIIAHDVEERPSRPGLANGGKLKGPPSAPPTIPPIIINPFSYQMPAPAIDPRTRPDRPPVTPPPRPGIYMGAFRTR